MINEPTCNDYDNKITYMRFRLPSKLTTLISTTVFSHEPSVSCILQCQYWTNIYCQHHIDRACRTCTDKYRPNRINKECHKVFMVNASVCYPQEARPLHYPQWSSIVFLLQDNQSDTIFFIYTTRLILSSLIILSAHINDI